MSCRTRPARSGRRRRRPARRAWAAAASRTSNEISAPGAVELAPAVLEELQHGIRRDHSAQHPARRAGNLRHRLEFGAAEVAAHDRLEAEVLGPPPLGRVQIRDLDGDV